MTPTGGRALAIAAVIALATGVPAHGAAQPLPLASPAEAGLDGPGLTQITRTLEAFVAQERIGGAVVGVARRGRLAYHEAVGLQDIGRGVPMSTQTLFRMYSMAKAVTAVAAMVLYEEGRYELSDPVSKYLPQFERVVVLGDDGSTRAPARPITVEDLFLHTAGLSHRNSSEYRESGVRSRDISLPQFIDNIVSVPLREDPGTRFRYGASPTVLGHLIEVWSGKPLDVFMRERVLEPLGMHDTMWWVPPEQAHRLATVYSSSDDAPLRPHRIEDVPFTVKPALLEGSVGLVSTVGDFLRFSQMLLNEGELDGARILRAETVVRMTRNGLPNAILATRRGGSGWALANVSVVVDAEVAGGGVHEGEYRWDGSAGTEFWVDPNTETVVVTAWQSSPANPDRLRQRIRDIVRDAIR